MSAPRCGNCRWKFARKVVEGEILHCSRFPPTWQDSQGVWGLPVVQPNMVCGEYKVSIADESPGWGQGEGFQDG